MLLTPLKSQAFSEQNEKQMYIGCYQNSKQYLGSEKSKSYCQCTVSKLSKKYSHSVRALKILNTIK